MKTPRFATIIELQDAIQRGTFRANELTAFVCKYELFIRAGTPDDIFAAYYGTMNACEDICALLGITDIQEV